ncbi:MAG: hypothetical protein V2A73_01330 [Pseudomonadota bacterium]
MIDTKRRRPLGVLSPLRLPFDESTPVARVELTDALRLAVASGARRVQGFWTDESRDDWVRRNRDLAESASYIGSDTKRRAKAHADLCELIRRDPRVLGQSGVVARILLDRFAVLASNERFPDDPGRPESPEQTAKRTDAQIRLSDIAAAVAFTTGKGQRIFDDPVVLEKAVWNIEACVHKAREYISDYKARQKRIDASALAAACDLEKKDIENLLRADQSWPLVVKTVLACRMNLSIARIEKLLHKARIRFR